LSVAHQIYDRFKAAGKPLNDGDIAIVDRAEYHYYQVRTLSGHAFATITHPLNYGASLDGKFCAISFGTVDGLFLGLWQVQDCDTRLNFVVRLRL
jgi:hypothetical protein